ncbi:MULTISPECIES: hypothetical protein [unclassified Mesorhizobium]|nr:MULTISPECIES: hypothetical protein [unclassified Mesorhizobium]
MDEISRLAPMSSINALVTLYGRHKEKAPPERGCNAAICSNQNL